MNRNVLITTLPLHSNYGGILQAYALQRALVGLGFIPVTDTSRPKSRLRRLRWLVVKHPYRWWRSVSPSSRADHWRQLRRRTARLQAFVDRHVRTGAAFEPATSERGLERVARAYRTFIVGSDQVWRAKYAHIPAQMFDLLEHVEGDRPRRISYAASFGVDDLSEYSEADRSRGRDLIRRFHAVSVRETSGVHICEEEFGVDAEQHVDPTMLLTPDEYVTLGVGPEGTAAPARGKLLVYRLDEGADSSTWERMLADRLGIPPLHLIGVPDSTNRGSTVPPLERVMPSVEHWISCFASADFVLTDSFHGCVFAILFNRPFAVQPNSERGATRFDTLLTTFGLGHHVLTESSTEIDERVFDPDWHTVNRILDAERKRGLDYLRANV